MNVLKLFFACLYLSACATAQTGQSYSSYKLHDPAKGMAQLIVYQPTFFGVQRSPKVKVNGINKCELSPKTFFVMDVDSRKTVTVAADLWDTFGTSKLSFKPEDKQRYFVQLTFHDASAGPGVLFGAVGGAVSGAMSGSEELPHDGPFIIQKVDKDVAKYQMRNASETLSCTGAAP